MFSTEINYEVVIFSVGDTKAGTKMGKMQVRNLTSGEIMNCILWEETLNRLDNNIPKPGKMQKKQKTKNCS